MTKTKITTDKSAKINAANRVNAIKNSTGKTAFLTLNNPSLEPMDIEAPGLEMEILFNKVLKYLDAQERTDRKAMTLYISLMYRDARLGIEEARISKELLAYKPAPVEKRRALVDAFKGIRQIRDELFIKIVAVWPLISEHGKELSEYILANRIEIHEARKTKTPFSQMDKNVKDLELIFGSKS